MAQTNYTPIQIYYSTTGGAVPVNTNLASGELAININDGILFYKDNLGAVQKIGYKLTPTTAGGTGLTAFTNGGIVYASSTSALATGSALVFDGTILGVGTTYSTYPLALKTSTAGSGIAVVADAAQPNYAGISFLQSNGSSQWGNISVEQTDLRFYTGTTEGFRLTSTSLYTASTINVGIGTSSPLAKLNASGGTTIASLTDWNSKANTVFTLANAAIRVGVGYDANDQPLIQGFDSTNNARPIGLQVYGGSVGIGTASPTEKLQVVGRIAVSGTNPSIRQTVQNAFLDLCGGTTVGTDPAIQIAGSTTTSDANTIFYNSNAHLFRTTSGGTTYATIDTSGNLLVGTTSSTNLQNNYSFLVGGSLPGAGSACFNGTNGNTVLQVNQTLDDNADRGQIYFYRNESLIGKITSSNTVTLFTSLSDYRLKNTIAPMTGALAKVALLKPCTYKWNSDNSDGQGFIAHELAEVFPIAVSGEKDAVDSKGNLDYQGVDTSVLVAILTAAIQEQQAIIQSLTARITALESA